MAAVGGLVFFSLSGATAYYKTPAELNTEGPAAGQRVRVAGKVVAGSVARRGAETDFDVTDGKATVNVTTRDILPDTFGAGVEVVAEGAMTEQGVFSAATVLAKCPSKFKARV